MIKIKFDRTPLESIEECSSVSSNPSADTCRITYVCDTWPAQRQTCNYDPSLRCYYNTGWYNIQITLFRDRTKCVNNLSTVALNNGTAEIRMYNLLTTSQGHYQYATKSHTDVL